MQAEMQNLMPDQSAATWGASLRQVSEDVGELVHDFGWLVGWATKQLGATVLQGQALLALRRRLGRPA